MPYPDNFNAAACDALQGPAAPPQTRECIEDLVETLRLATALAKGAMAAEAGGADSEALRMIVLLQQGPLKDLRPEADALRTALTNSLGNNPHWLLERTHGDAGRKMRTKALFDLGILC